MTKRGAGKGSVSGGSYTTGTSAKQKYLLDVIKIVVHVYFLFTVFLAGLGKDKAFCAEVYVTNIASVVQAKIFSD